MDIKKCVVRIYKDDSDFDGKIVVTNVIFHEDQPELEDKSLLTNDEMFYEIVEYVNDLKSSDCTIRVFESNNDHVGTLSYAKVWFGGNEPLIAEPFGCFDSIDGWRWYYNRETNFKVIGNID
jgi:hypothetical protein